LKARNLSVMGNTADEILVAIGHFEMPVASPNVARLKRSGPRFGGSAPEIFGIAFHQSPLQGPDSLGV
jgi:hypothetical protein